MSLREAASIVLGTGPRSPMHMPDGGRSVQAVCVEMREAWKVLNFSRNWGMRKPDYPPRDVVRFVPRPTYTLVLYTTDAGFIKGYCSRQVIDHAARA